MNGSFFEGGIFPTWSLPPHIARNYVGPKPTARPTTGASASSSKTADSLNSQLPSASHARSVRFPVAPEGHLFDRNTIQSLYSLPPAGLRFDRLDKHHAIHVRNIDGLYYPKDLVRHVLRPEPGNVKRVLDLAATSSYLAGGGGGNWAIDMALEFPHVEVICIDRQPHSSKQAPRNCQFQVIDYLEEMPGFHGRFDVVHARTIGNGVGILEYPNLIEEIGRCLKPGGVTLLCDGDFQLLDHNLEPQEMALDDEQNDPPMYSWLARLFFETYNTFKTAGSAMDAGIMLERWLKDCEAFENVQGAKVHTPIGPWKTSPNPQEHAKLQYTGALMRENLIEYAHALIPVLLKEGPNQYTLGQTKEWVRNAQHELETLSVRMHVRYHYAWAVKRYGYVDPPWHEPYEPSVVDHPQYIYVDPEEEGDEDFDSEEDEEDPQYDDGPQEGHDEEQVPAAAPPKRFRSTSRSPPRRYITLGGNGESDKGDAESDLNDEEDSSLAEDRRRHSPRRRLSPPHETGHNLEPRLPPPPPAVPLSSPGSSLSTSTTMPHSNNYEYINPYPHLKFTPTADWRPDPEAVVRARLDGMRVNGHSTDRGKDRAERLENLDWRNGGGSTTTEKKKRKAMAPLAKAGERGLYAPRPGEPGVSAGGGR
ncbi:hypothetical protein M407DRAFT_19892 [Tulasnella calospora MUT 4182]|uniref:Methyltransferase domain-containing protein n=1 Tax=Tulasnella calospora MUT 4182 TaxID=1051891 RepID=A0A0C3QGZ2_9AGAM|nr:hypothetical protein M407DRAFT_19892 [Tulasnella calospora MUT 4182]